MSTAHTTGLDDILFAPTPAPPAHPFRWRLVLQLLRTLDKTPEQTDAALRLFDAVGGCGGERTFQTFFQHEDGLRLLRERPRLAEHMGDRTKLAAMPEGSLGRAYLDFASKNGFAADGLVNLNREIEREETQELDATRQWFWDRFTAMHDLWHVVTGCDTSPDGEGVLIAFTHGQVPQRGYRVLLSLIAYRANLNLALHGQLVRAWRSGRRADALIRARWEDLLPLPLEEVRSQLGVKPLIA